MEINQDFVANAGALFGAIGVVVFGAQKAIKTWSEGRNDIQKIGIDSDLFTRMSNEIKRLSDTNQTLEQEIDELRTKHTKILQEFSAFRLETTERQIMLLTLKQQLIDCNSRVEEMQRVNNSSGS